MCVRVRPHTEFVGVSITQLRSPAHQKDRKRPRGVTLYLSGGCEAVAQFFPKSGGEGPSSSARRE